VIRDQEEEIRDQEERNKRLEIRNQESEIRDEGRIIEESLLKSIFCPRGIII
jgi:hypothetical protein